MMNYDLGFFGWKKIIKQGRKKNWLTIRQFWGRYVMLKAIKGPQWTQRHLYKPLKRWLCERIVAFRYFSRVDVKKKKIYIFFEKKNGWKKKYIDLHFHDILNHG